jgi:hypothetical protein
MQNIVYINHAPSEKVVKKGIEIYTDYMTTSIEEGNDSIDIIFVGVIYNAQEICKTLMIDYMTPEQTIKTAYKAYGIEETIRILDGNYTFVLHDHNVFSDTTKIYIARDLIGIYPLYIHTIPIKTMPYKTLNSPTILKRLDIMVDNDPLYDNYVISSESFVEGGVTRTCLPGSYSTFSLPFRVNAKWRFEGETRVSTLAIMPLLIQPAIYNYYSRTLHQIFENSISKRIRNADIVICIANDIYGTYMAKVVRELCILSNKEVNIEKTLMKGLIENTSNHVVILHTGFIENLFQIRETNPVIENRVLRDHIENNSLYDIQRCYNEDGLHFPFWDITWIQFYMTMSTNYRKEFSEKYFL